jgi:aspartyl-tRNA(Asn)/glutamyl-tRNA(Gln) amidotransferase subunit C
MADIFDFFTKNMAIKREQIKYLAELAKLQISSDEEKKMSKEIGQILNYIDKLNFFDSVESDDKFIDPVKNINIWREDETESLPAVGRQSILDNVPAQEDDLIKTKPIFKI